MHQEHINQIIRTYTRAQSAFIYDIAHTDHERLVSFVPLHIGETISVKLTDGTFLRNRRIEAIHHDSPLQSIDEQIVAPIVTLSDSEV